MQLYTTLLYQPLFNVLIFLYVTIPGRDMGFAIIMLTILVRVLLWPLSNSALAAQKKLQDLQPKLEEVKQQHKENKQAQGQAIMALYKEHKINPAGSCLPLLIQLPIFFALYQVLNSGLQAPNFSLLYSFVQNPDTINHLAFGFLDLSKPNIVLALLAGAAQYWQGSQLVTKKPKPENAANKDESMAAMMNTQMKYMMPIVTVVIGTQLPAGLSLYWCVFTVLYALQQYLLLKKHSPKIA